MKNILIVVAMSTALAAGAYASDSQPATGGKPPHDHNTQQKSKDDAKSQSTQHRDAKSQGDAKAGDPAAILSKIHATNQMEIQFGELARSKAKSEDVRKYGDRLARDHGAADEKVRALAKQKGLSIEQAPASPAEKQHIEEQKQTLKRLSTLEGESFDKAFLEAMVQGHDQTVDSLKSARAAIQDKEVGTLVDELMPVLEKHEAIARNPSDAD